MKKIEQIYTGQQRRTMTGMLSVRAKGDGETSRTIEGTAIVFGKRSDPLYEDDLTIIREVIAPEAVTRDFLDRQEILCTLYHNNDKLLARSSKGKGTLKYTVDSKGVHFEFEAPDTVDGQTALDLVRRGDIGGCSFAFTMDAGGYTRTETKENGKRLLLLTVNKIRSITDFTLTPLPYYADTEVGVRMRDMLSAEDIKPEAVEPEGEAYKEEVSRLRSIADNINY